MVFHLLDDDELDFPFTGPTRFEGLELPDVVRCNPRACATATCGPCRTTWRKSVAVARETTSITRSCGPASRLDAALAAFLSNRLGMHHKNRV